MVKIDSLEARSTNPDKLWLDKHRPELAEKYAGQWVVISNQQVVDSGNSAQRLMDAYDKKEGNYLLANI